MLAVLRQARLISGDSCLMMCVVGSRWILGYHGVLLQEVTQKSLRSLRYCNHNFYFVGSTSECNLGVTVSCKIVDQNRTRVIVSFPPK